MSKHLWDPDALSYSILQLTLSLTIYKYKQIPLKQNYHSMSMVVMTNSIWIKFNSKNNSKASKEKSIFFTLSGFNWAGYYQQEIYLKKLSKK